MAAPRYCLQCGAALTRRVPPYDSKERDACSKCDWVYYPQAKIAAGTLLQVDSKLVLIRRGIEPGYGKWGLPAGFLEPGESPEDAALRETEEETGLKVELEGLHGLFSEVRPAYQILLAVYHARVVGGTPQPSNETLEVRAYSAREIPWAEIAFISTRSALERWADGRK
jgi:ADP-ribose pyrophosphatase YjhB (NUDIX family)